MAQRLLDDESERILKRPAVP